MHPNHIIEEALYEEALYEEEEQERQKDRTYWAPLKAELEQLRLEESRKR